MIESKTLGDAVGIQRGDVIDNSTKRNWAMLSDGMVVGRFKRGRMDRPFMVTAANYQALLGYDSSNPSFIVVDDAFRNSLNRLTIMRLGKPMLATAQVVIPPVIPPVVPPPPDNAITSLSGWYLESHSIDGDLVTLNALKQSSDGGFKSDITHTPLVDDIGQFLLSAEGLSALTTTVNDLLGAGVTWQLDIENKRVSYTEAQ